MIADQGHEVATCLACVTASREPQSRGKLRRTIVGTRFATVETSCRGADALEEIK